MACIALGETTAEGFRGSLRDERKRSFDRTLRALMNLQDRFGGIGSHISSTIYLTLRGRMALLKSGLVLANVAGARNRRTRSSRSPISRERLFPRWHGGTSPQHLFAWRKAARAGLTFAIRRWLRNHGKAG
jgi:hypothetical protein